MRDINIEELRAAVRQRRSGLSSLELDDAQNSLAENAESLESIQSARQVLSYLPTAGEISPAALIDRLVDAAIYLPRISDYQTHSMQFFPAENPRERNRFNIKEPVAVGSAISADKLDVVLLPLVLFDRSGSRVGMGGGYYDRAFSFRLTEPTTCKPQLIGVAHHFQEVNLLPRETWDVPLDAIITDQELIEPG